jgi:phytoene dehydrogenase-like protein
LTPLSRQGELTLPHCSVSISPTICRAAATGVRKRHVLKTSSSRRSNRTRRIFARASSVHSSLSPLDLEEKLGLAGGDIFHGALGLDQLWAARPMLGYGDYRTPLKCLYLCGSGAHPGGGVTGLPGHNAAREILRDGLSKTVSSPNR